MKEIKLTPTAQLALLGALLAALAAVFVAELPELRRYLSIRSM